MTTNDTSEQHYDIEIIDKDGNTIYTNINNNGYSKYKSSTTQSNKFLGKVFKGLLAFLTSFLAVILGGISLIFSIGVILISTLISIIFILFRKLKRK